MARTIDQTKALELLEQTGNAAEVARRMGFHENSIRRIERLHRKVCVRCQKLPAAGKTLCADCLVWEQDRIKKRRKSRLRQGLCTQCGEPRSPLSRHLCETHRIMSAEANERYDQREKARGAPNKGVPNAHHKRQSIYERYGQGGVDAWEYYGGKCAACGECHKDISVHLHHIDENQSNNARSNFICLCFRCHRAVHLLLSSKNRAGLIEVFEGMYPDRPLR